MIPNNFTDESIVLLKSAGWYPGRLVAVELEHWIAKLHPRGFTIFASARKFLAEFGGLRIEQPTPPRSGYLPMEFDPTVCLETSESAAIVRDLFDYYAEQLGQELYPIGLDVDSNYYVAISEDGKVFELLDHMEMIGMDFQEAMANISTGFRPRELYFY